MKLFFCFISGSLEKWSTMFFFFPLPLETPHPPTPRSSPPEVETEMPAIFHRALQPDHEEAFTELSATRRAAAAAAATWTIDVCSFMFTFRSKKIIIILSDSCKTLSSGGAEWTGPHGHHVKKKKKTHDALQR